MTYAAVGVILGNRRRNHGDAIDREPRRSGLLLGSGCDCETVEGGLEGSAIENWLTLAEARVEGERHTVAECV